MDIIKLENTRFIFRTNFSGDPSRDTFGSDDRKANIVIPNVNMALAMKADGLNVKETQPREGEEEGFVPTYFIPFKVNYKTKYESGRPKITLRSGSAEIQIDEETISRLDGISIKNVNADLNLYENPKTGKKSLYLKEMTVEQDFSNVNYLYSEFYE